MAAEPPQSPVTEAVPGLKVCWIFPGQLEAAAAGWFGRFRAQKESREDTYLLDPPLAELSVKVRGGGALEVKAYRGSPGILEAAGRPGWTPVAKRRRISQFSGADRQIVAPAAGLGQPRCEVELTGVRTRGQDW
jgi:hypothetical protein